MRDTDTSIIAFYLLWHSYDSDYHGKYVTSMVHGVFIVTGFYFICVYGIIETGNSYIYGNRYYESHRSRDNLNVDLANVSNHLLKWTSYDPNRGAHILHFSKLIDFIYEICMVIAMPCIVVAVLLVFGMENTGRKWIASLILGGSYIFRP